MKCQFIKENINKSSSVGSQGFSSLSPESVDMLVSPADDTSDKILKIVAKYQALEDCIAGVKKGYEKGVITLD